MRIVQLLPELNEGGVERGTVELSRELVKRGHESIIISIGGKLVEQIESDGGIHVRVDVCSKNFFTLPFRIAKLRTVLEDLKPDVLHARSRAPAWLTYLANKKLKIPFVTTVHGFNSISPYSEIMTRGDRIICVSGAVKAYIQQYYHTFEEKIVVIPRGVDLERFNPQKADEAFVHAFRQTYGLEKKFVMTTVGRITQLKDLETFIEAAAIIKRTMPNLRALVVGGVHKDKKNYFNVLKKLVDRLEVTENIIFTGSQEKVAEIYMLSDVVVSSSKKPESFGRSVAEAIAMNTPVVATEHGGVLDIIQAGENGVFYPVGESEVLAEKVMQVKAFSFDGYGYICEHFSLDKMVENTLKVYADVV